MSYNSVILTKPLDFANNSDAIIAEADKFAKFLADDTDRRNKALSTSQLRRFYGEVKRIQLNGYDVTEVKLLKPKLAYAVGRNKDSKIKDFYNIISVAIDNIEDESSFRSFIKMFEAIVAYHKLYGKN